MSKVDLEAVLYQQLYYSGLIIGMEQQFRFHKTRRWRFDMAWPAHKLAVEVDGGTWTGGRHVTGKGYEADCEKLAEALCLGWRVLRVTGKHIDSGQALQWIEKALEVV